ncbi:hypothetical protein SUGI_0210100 [Cryptomeria japonica]|nr:hypothetical protein SUGI_0210100 [Cryptomeria japonica]
MWKRTSGIFFPTLNTKVENFVGGFADGKFYVKDYQFWPNFEVFDSYIRSWKTVENRSNSLHFLPVFGCLYSLFGRELIGYEYNQDMLQIVGPLSMEDWNRYIEFSVLVSNKIFVSKWDPIQSQAFYMLVPPTETGGAFKLIGIERPLGLQGSAIAAATLDL